MFAKLTKYFFLWRILIALAIIPAMFIIPLKGGYTGLSQGLHFWENIYNSWSNFDGIQYLELAKMGYGKPTTHLMYVFFPVYPWIVRQFSFLGNLNSALLVSHISFLLTLPLLYKLLRLDFNKKVSFNTILLLFVFPTSFFFGSVYNESLFLLLVLACFYFSRKNHFFLASLVAMIASATRVTGVLLWGVVFIELLSKNKDKLKKMLTDPRSVWLSLPPLGLLAYIKFQSIKTGDPFYFITAQPGFGANKVADKIILLHQVFFRYVKMIIFVDHTSPLFFTVLLELLTALFFLALVLLGIKKLRNSYVFYAVLSYLIPTFTGTFASLPRYVLVIFPAFITLSLWFSKQTKKTRLIYITLNIVIGIIAVSLFSRGYFVG